MRRSVLRGVSGLCFALGLAAVIAIIPASQYINEPDNYFAGRMADLFIIAAFFLPLAAVFAVLGVLLYKRSCRDNCQL